MSTPQYQHMNEEITMSAAPGGSGAEERAPRYPSRQTRNAKDDVEGAFDYSSEFVSDVVTDVKEEVKKK
ncbi:hypothetical protein Pcinc_042483 [Petrolisthes cinctipes]|uniref:Uncharacterized protein n=1 Tax=Petrolisthes cinctipes TaxID=88211 RepID=A0AAE1BHR4_PETCI|nr:hypothetical protein Pcinc_042483 [Petrolisthes cinctipes]